jgi:hypothetical protein
LSRLKPRNSRREVTHHREVERPDLASGAAGQLLQADAESESMATSDATPTEMPIVVSELRKRRSRRLRSKLKDRGNGCPVQACLGGQGI